MKPSTFYIIFLWSKSNKFSKHLSPHCSLRFSNPTTCALHLLLQGLRLCGQEVPDIDSWETNPWEQFSFLHGHNTVFAPRSIISIEPFPSCVPMCLGVTIWACSPHKLPKGKVWHLPLFPLCCTILIPSMYAAVYVREGSSQSSFLTESAPPGVFLVLPFILWAWAHCFSWLYDFILKTRCM